jgi:hypothetical protein
MAKPKTCKACGYEFHIHSDYIRDWFELLMPCPVCNETFCVMKPDTERILQRLQFMYLGAGIKNNKEKYYNEMYKILVSYTQSLIKGHFSNRITSMEMLEEKSIDAVHFLFEEYLKNSNFRITISFGGFLLDKIRQVLFGKKYHDSGQVSINYTFDDGNEVEYEDKKDLLKEIEDHQNKYLLSNYFTNLIFSYESECEDKRENFLRLLAFDYFMRYGERKADNFFKAFGRYGKSRYEETILLFKHELRRNHRETLEANGLTIVSEQQWQKYWGDKK